MVEMDPKEARRREILDAALRAFAEKGYDKTSMDDIVQASGLSKGTLYWYFENKQALFVALIGQVFDEAQAVFEQQIAEMEQLSPPERLRALIIGSATVFEDEFIGLYVDFFIQAWQYEDVQKTLLRVYDFYTHVLSELIQEGIDLGFFRSVHVPSVARSITGAIDGVMIQKLFDPGASDVMVSEFADVIVHGLLKGEQDV